MLEPLRLCVPETKMVKGEKRTVYVVNPAIMYPAVVARMREIAAGDEPLEVIDNDHPSALTNWKFRCKQIPDDLYELALVPREQVLDRSAGQRAYVLGIARKFFKASLRATKQIHVTGTQQLLRMYLVNENAGELDGDGNQIPSAYRY